MTKLNKKGTSLVELIAVIVIMGIIAAIAIPTTIGVINRNKEKAAVESANKAYGAANVLLLEAATGDTLPAGVEKLGTTGIFYISAAKMVENGDLTSFDDTVFFVYVPASASSETLGAGFYARGEAPTDLASVTNVAVSVDGISVIFDTPSAKFSKK